MIRRKLASAVVARCGSKGSESDAGYREPRKETEAGESLDGHLSIEQLEAGALSCCGLMSSCATGDRGLRRESMRYSGFRMKVTTRYLFDRNFLRHRFFRSWGRRFPGYRHTLSCVSAAIWRRRLSCWMNWPRPTAKDLVLRENSKSRIAETELPACQKPVALHARHSKELSCRAR